MEAPFYDIGVAWIDNILVPIPRWGEGVTVVDWALGNQHGVLIGADVLWRSVLPVCPYYLPRSPPENTRVTAHRVHVALLQ